MRIVQVSVGNIRMPPKQGSAPLQVIYNTSRHLVNMGHKVVILDRRYSRDDSPIEHVEGVEIHRLRVMQVPSVRTPGFIQFILAELNAIFFALAVSCYLHRSDTDFDIIHLHLTSIGLVVVVLNRGLRKKIFYTCHLSQWAFASSRLRLPERIHLLIDAFLMRQVQRVIALNDAAKESFTLLGKVRADKISVLPNGVDTSFFNADTQIGDAITRYGLEGKSVVLFVGRLAKIKGVEYLLKAADITVNSFGYRNTLFVLAGPHTFTGVDQPYSIKELRNYIRQHQLNDNVTLTGALPLEDKSSIQSV